MSKLFRHLDVSAWRNKNRNDKNEVNSGEWPRNLGGMGCYWVETVAIQIRNINLHLIIVLQMKLNWKRTAGKIFAAHGIFSGLKTYISSK